MRLQSSSDKLMTERFQAVTACRCHARKTYSVPRRFSKEFIRGLLYRVTVDVRCLVGKRITVRYDTRCYFNVRSTADMSQLNLPHGTNN